MRLLRKILYCVVVLLAVGCESGLICDDAPPTQVKPTVPLKRRPIVPTTKLPRPRVVDAPQITVEEFSVDVDLAPDFDYDEDFAFE